MYTAGSCYSALLAACNKQSMGLRLPALKATPNPKPVTWHARRKSELSIRAHVAVPLQKQQNMDERETLPVVYCARGKAYDVHVAARQPPRAAIVSQVRIVTNQVETHKNMRASHGMASQAENGRKNEQIPPDAKGATQRTAPAATAALGP